ncbi:uncharacterized protein [Vicugna pacos]|uniref:Uncharacterized protein isoform X3 n=1 Tax=Vicugna pacos TaxID=30538 RepID=A0ABM5DL85_VICPA
MAILIQISDWHQISSALEVLTPSKSSMSVGINFFQTSIHVEITLEMGPFLCQHPKSSRFQGIYGGTASVTRNEELKKPLEKTT